MIVGELPPVVGVEASDDLSTTHKSWMVVQSEGN
jgi:hypothetical protein